MTRHLVFAALIAGCHGNGGVDPNALADAAGADAARSSDAGSGSGSGADGSWVLTTDVCDSSLVDRGDQTTYDGFSGALVLAFDDTCTPDGCQGAVYARLTGITLFDTEGSQPYSQQIPNMSFEGSYYADNHDALKGVSAQELGVQIGYLNDGSLHSADSGLYPIAALFNTTERWPSYCYIDSETSIGSASFCTCTPDGSAFEMTEHTWVDGVYSETGGSDYATEAACQTAIDAGCT